LANSKVKYINGWAKFVDAHSIEVNDEKVTGKYMLIAVGGEPSMPNIPGKEYALNSDDFFKIEDLPKTVAISGAGYIAVELAGILNALGSKVIISVDRLISSFPFSFLFSFHLLVSPIYIYIYVCVCMLYVDVCVCVYVVWMCVFVMR